MYDVRGSNITTCSQKHHAGRTVTDRSLSFYSVKINHHQDLAVWDFTKLRVSNICEPLILSIGKQLHRQLLQQIGILDKTDRPKVET